MKYYFNYGHTGSYSGFVWGAGRCKQGNREGGARLFLSLKDSDGGVKLDNAHLQRQMICFYQDEEKRNPAKLSKAQSFCCYHVVYFHISLLCNKVCSLELQFGLVTKQKMFSLLHSSEILSSEQLRVSFFYLLSSFLSNMQCKNSPEKQCQATPSV